MTHEEFANLAQTAGRNAQGLRPLAAHVRELYSAIRILQKEDNSFAYIAEIIQAARQDQTDPDQFMHRIKSYYHRDRKAVDDPIILRGRMRHQKEKTAPPTPPDAQTPTMLTPAHPAGLPSARLAQEPSTREFMVEQPVAMAKPGVPSPQISKLEEAKSQSGGGALTAAVHRRPGRRRLVSGG